MPRPNLKSLTLTAVVNTADATPVVIGAADSIANLLPYFVQIQVIAAAGTALIEVQHPGGSWTTHTSGADPVTNDIVNLSSGKGEAYSSARVTFAGTGGTNTIRARLETRQP